MLIKRFAGFALLLAPLLASADRLPVEDFFRDPTFTSVSLSPSGEYLAVSRPEEDRTVLAILRTDDLTPLGRWDYGAGRHIDSVTWVSDSRFLMNVTRKVGRFDFRVGQGDLYASNVDGTRRSDIPNGNTYQIVDTLRDDDRHVLVSRSIESAFLMRLDSYDGSVRPVATAPIDNGSFVVDREGQVRYAVGSNADLSEVVYERVGDRWNLIHSATMGEGKSRRPWGISSDGEGILMSVSDAGEPSRVVRVDARSGEEFELSANANVDPSSALTSGDGDTLLGVKYYDGIPSYDWVDTGHPETKLAAGLVAAFPDHAVTIDGISRDGRKVLVFAFSDRDPGSYYLFDHDSGQASFLLSRMEWINPEQMSEMRPITVKSRDGKTLHGYLTVPRGGDGTQLPLVLNPHGGPHGPRDAWGFNPEVQFLANRGYAVLQINFRGSGGYGRSFESSGYRNWGTTMIDDMTDAVQWTIDQGIADPSRICTYGASYGGYAALQSVVRNPTKYQCTIGYVGVYSIPLMFTDGDIPESESGRSYLRMIHPGSKAEQQAQSPAYNIDKINIPVMLVHGERDRRVPMSQYRLLSSRLEQAGKPAEVTVLEAREGHGFFDFDNQVELYTAMEAFLDRHIGEKAGRGVALTD